MEETDKGEKTDVIEEGEEEGDGDKRREEEEEEEIIDDDVEEEEAEAETEVKGKEGGGKSNKGETSSCSLGENFASTFSVFACCSFMGCCTSCGGGYK